MTSVLNTEAYTWLTHCYAGKKYLLNIVTVEITFFFIFYFFKLFSDCSPCAT